MRTLVMLVALSSVISSEANAQTILDWYVRGQYQLIVDAVVNDPNADPNYIYVAADSLHRLNRDSEAFDQYQRLSAIGGAPWVYLGWSGSWEMLGDMQNAMLAGQWAVDSAPGWVLPEFHLGKVENRGGLHAQAAARQDWVISQVPWFAWPYYHSGVSHLNQGGAYHQDIGHTRLYQYIRMLNPVCPHPETFFAVLTMCDIGGSWWCGVPIAERNYCQ